MGRGRMGNSGGGGSRGSGGFSGGRRVGRSHSHTTVFVGSHGHHRHDGGSGSPIVAIIVGALFVIVGIGVLFGGFAQLFKYGTVDAKCVLNEKSNSYYYSTYEYTIDGKDYRNRSMQSWEFEEEINKVVEIYYDKNNPNKIYEECPTSKGEAALIIVGGFVFAAIGSLPVFLGIKQLKGAKSGNGAELGSSPAAQETHTRCQYCGAKFNKNSDSCPKCGAGKNE